MVVSQLECPPKRLKSALEITKNKRPLKELTNTVKQDDQHSSNISETSAAGAIRGRGRNGGRVPRVGHRPAPHRRRQGAVDLSGRRRGIAAAVPD